MTCDSAAEEFQLLRLTSMASWMRKSFKDRWTFQANFGGSKRRREYDHLLISYRFRKGIRDVKVHRSTYLNSDHCLLTAKVCLHPPRVKRRGMCGLGKKLRRPEVAKAVSDALTKQFVGRSFNGEDLEQRLNEVQWPEVKSCILSTAENFPEAKIPRKPWIHADILDLIEQRKNTKAVLFNMACDDPRWAKTKQDLKRVQKEITQERRKGYRLWIDGQLNEAKRANATGNMKRLYEIVRIVSG